MPVSETSLEAFYKRTIEGKGALQRERIMAVMDPEQPRSRQDIADLFDPHLPRTVDGGPPIPLSSVCSAVFQLKETHLLERAYLALPNGGRSSVEFLRPTGRTEPPATQGELPF